MNLSMIKAEAKLSQAVTAWETLRPEKTFAGLTLAQFKASIQKALDGGAKVESLKDALAAGQTERATALDAALQTVQRVVNAVKSDVDEGEDGAFYEALGYVRKSERKSGLSRGKKTAAVATA
jgi:hypothetical protein